MNERYRNALAAEARRRRNGRIILDVSFEEWLLVKGLAEEIRDGALSRSRQADAAQALRALDQAMEQTGAPSLACHQRAENWLEPYIEAALASKLCIEITCGTCGSTPFKSGLVSLASGGLREGISDVDQATLRKIGTALAQVQPPNNPGKLEGFERAAMTVIYFLWSRAHAFERQIKPLLAGTWSSDVLSKMRVHHAKRARSIDAVRARLGDVKKYQD